MYRQLVSTTPQRVPVLAVKRTPAEITRLVDNDRRTKARGIGENT
jgi:hypothetical protein